MNIKQVIPRLFFSTVFGILGCASDPVGKNSTSGANAEGRKVGIEARVQIQNKIEKKSYTLVLEALALEPSRLRLDLTGPFGAPMGKLVLRDNLIGILAPQQKKAYTGEVSDRSFQPLFPLTLNPRSLITILLGDSPQGWACEKSETDDQICRNPEGTLTLERNLNSDGGIKKWSVSSTDFSMTVLPLKTNMDVQLKSDSFTLIIPPAYSKYKLP